MLATLSLTPRTLDPALSSSPEAFALGLGCLNELGREEGLFLDLRGGLWSRSAEASGPAAKKFLTFVRKESRLISVTAALDAEPEEDEHWLWEAQAVDKLFPCAAIVTHRALAAEYAGQPKIVSFEGLNCCGWWEGRSPSLTLARETKA